MLPAVPIYCYFYGILYYQYFKRTMISGLPGDMTVVTLTGEERRLKTKKANVPEPGKGEVLVKISAAPVNPSDLARIRNVPFSELDSFIPGLEGSGRVVAAGGGILPKLLMGRRVACSAKHASSGTWAEYMVTGAGSCFPVGRKITDEQASMVIVNPMTALAFIYYARQNNHRAIINTAAASALGKMVELLGEKYRIPVINVVRRDEKQRELAGEGRKYVLNSSDDEFPAKLNSLAQELGATLLFDAVGGSPAETMIDAMPDGSTYVLYGTLSGEKLQVTPSQLINHDKRVTGFYLGNWVAENGMLKTLRNLTRVNSLIRDGMTTRIQGRFGLDDVQKAVDQYLENMSGGKVLLVPGIGKQ
jgi:NADPH:quinone reductase-like Zn-dependent oxidoreductase